MISQRLSQSGITPLGIHAIMFIPCGLMHHNRHGSPPGMRGNFVPSTRISAPYSGPTWLSQYMSYLFTKTCRRPRSDFPRLTTLFCNSLVDRAVTHDRLLVARLDTYMETTLTLSTGLPAKPRNGLPARGFLSSWMRLLSLAITPLRPLTHISHQSACGKRVPTHASPSA